MKWTSVQLSLRATVAAIVSLLAAGWLDLRYPIYAFIAAVLVTDLDPKTSRRLGLRRLAATIIGACCGALLTQMLPSSAWSVGAGVLVAMLASQLLKAEDGARVAGYICGIILLDHSYEPWTYALHRFLETALGILAAWAITYVPKFTTPRAKSTPSP
jgi:uncharacterized membrane protein YgaE (UPF0421/DUF939 family)